MPNPKLPPAQRPMIVTARMDPADLSVFNTLRERYFPVARNYLFAHLTLFHQIPCEQRADFMAAAAESLIHQSPFSVRVLAPVSIGHGVAVPVAADRLQAIRQPLRERFADVLRPQDLNPWKRPHLTLQNKVSREEARRTLEAVKQEALPPTLLITGLQYYRYDYGPWSKLGELVFTA